MRLKAVFCFVALFMCACVSEAQLVVAVSPVKAEGNKASVKLDFRNNLTNAVESARASVFLMNGETVVEHGTRWVIGGTKKQPSLAPGGTNFFYFVITSEKPFPKTNMTAKVNVDRVVLEGGTLANLAKDVEISKGK